MEKEMEKKVYDTRVIPFVRYEKRIKNGKSVEVAVDSFSNEERKQLSCKPRMLWMNKEHVYLAEQPLVYTEGTGIRGFLYYAFIELTSEEQEKYYDRSIVIQTTKPDVVIVYGEESKRFFGKKKVRERR